MPNNLDITRLPPAVQKWIAKNFEKKAERKKKKSEENKKKREARYKRERAKVSRANARKRKHQKEMALKKKERQKQREIEKKERAKLAPKKRKRGRPRKPGRKKNYSKRWREKVKKRNRVRKVYHPPIKQYKVVLCRNYRQAGYFGKYYTINEAYAEANRVIEEKKFVDIPQLLTHHDSVNEAINEILILQKNDKGNLENAILRNEFGKLVQQTSNIDAWVIIDKFRFYEEQTFWVWGYDKSKDRKTAAWIYENLMMADLEGDYDTRQIYQYKNKIVMITESNEIHLVICPMVSNAISLYNKLFEWKNKYHADRVVFMGYVGNSGNKKNLWMENLLMKLTGWSKYKVKLNTTSKKMIHETEEKYKERMKARKEQLNKKLNIDGDYDDFENKNGDNQRNVQLSGVD